MSTKRDHTAPRLDAQRQPPERQPPDATEPRAREDQAGHRPPLPQRPPSAALSYGTQWPSASSTAAPARDGHHTTVLPQQQAEAPSYLSHEGLPWSTSSISHPMLSGLHNSSMSQPALAGSAASQEPLWELAALGENLSGEHSGYLAPHSPLPATSAQMLYQSPDDTTETGDQTHHAGGVRDVEPSSLLPEPGAEGWYIPPPSVPEPQPISPLATSASFAPGHVFVHRTSPTLQLTPPSYRQPHSNRCPSMLLWCGISRVLSAPLVAARQSLPRNKRER